jgi:hypothetical protein
MLIEKLQMFAYSCLLIKYKFLWLKMWNEFVVYMGGQEIPQAHVF